MDIIFNIPSMEAFSQVWDHILTHINNPNAKSVKDIDKGVISQAKDELLQLLMYNKFDMSNVREILANKYEQEKVANFIAVIEHRKVELLYSTMLNHNSKHLETVLDFDWCLKLVLGTSDLKVLKYPLLQLTTSTLNSRGNYCKTVFDINKGVLDKIIKMLEDIDSNI